MSLKLYTNLLSQPGRAVFLFLKANGIPFEFKLVNIAKGTFLSVGCDIFSYSAVTIYMLQSPSSQDSFSASQGVSRIFGFQLESIKLPSVWLVASLYW
jgi:hypothetical protein